MTDEVFNLLSSVQSVKGPKHSSSQGVTKATPQGFPPSCTARMKHSMGGGMNRRHRTIFSICASALMVLAILWLSGCGGGGGTGGGNGGGTPDNVVVDIAPKKNIGLASAQTQQFTSTVTGDSKNLGVTWSVDGTSGGNTTVGLINSSGLYTAPASGGTHTVAAASIADTTKTDSATLAVTDLPGVFTSHNNLARDGTNTKEYVLTPSVVNSATFGKLFSCSTDGVVYTQPLWVPNVSFGADKHNAVLAATEHDSVYAFDADRAPCVTLWQASMLDSVHGASPGEITVPLADLFGVDDVQPEVGITGTPVIDPSSSTLYVVSKSEDSSGGFHQRLHALDLSTGSEKFGGPTEISASIVGAGYDSSGATVTFDPHKQFQRAGLALVNGVVYVTWASHGDVNPYHGWIIGYKTTDLSRVAAYNITADGERGGIWMSGGAPAADDANVIYLSTGNGTFDHDSTVTPNTDLGDSVLRLTTASGVSLTDWFSPFNQSDLANNDQDLGSGGVVVLPDQLSGPSHLLVAGGKQGTLYLINRDSMGHFCGTCTSSTGDTNTVQSFDATTGFFGTPAFWQNGLYISGTSDKLSVFAFNPAIGKFNASPSSQAPTTFSFPGSTPSISSQDVADGIVWAIDTSQYGTPGRHGLGPAILHAYDATNLATELWNSSQAANNRDQAGQAASSAFLRWPTGRFISARGVRSTLTACCLSRDLAEDNWRCPL